MPKKIFLSVGEQSGDLHASKLMYELKKIYPDAKFVGLGGDKCQAAGLELIAHTRDLAVVGFWEVAKKYNYFKSLLAQCENIILNEKFDIFIPVDYPGFNIRLAKKVRKANIPVVYYIAPQLWAWGKNRALDLAKSIDKLLVVLPFEKQFFEQFSIKTKFVGHPLLDEEIFQQATISFLQRKEQIAIFPGSRKQEIIKHQDFVIELVNEIKANLPNYSVILAKSSNLDLQLFDNLSRIDNLKFSEKSWELMRESKFGIIKTGTTNLEAALMNMPFAMFYKTSAITYHLSKYLIKLPHISLVNILMGKEIIPEYIQSDAKAKNIVDFAKNLDKNTDKILEMEANFLEIRQMLGGSGASETAALTIKNWIK